MPGANICDIAEWKEKSLAQLENDTARGLLSSTATTAQPLSGLRQDDMLRTHAHWGQQQASVAR